MKEFRLEDSRIIELSEKFTEIVKGIKNTENLIAIENLMAEIGNRFFVAPASNRLEYHNCFPGGLLEHSMRVYSNLSTMANKKNISQDSIIVCGLFHDLGKVGTVNEDYFLPNESQWHREKLGMMYEHNESLIYLGTAIRSVKLLTDFGVKLTDEEYQAIIIHDGQYTPENKPYAHKETWLALLLHQADMQACQFEKERWAKIQ